MRSMLKKSEIEQFKLLLLSAQARMRGDVEQLTAEALDRSSGGSDSRSPTHIAELGTLTYEQDFSLRVVENDQEVLDEIIDALNRVDKGTYGQCEMCVIEGKAPSKSWIPKTRLKAIPYARNCVQCEQKREELTR
jgi:DnaK suppressor protein